MEQYISKSALLAEIEKLYDEKGTFYAADVLYNLKEWLDTFEVKEVDFEEELKYYCNNYYNCDYPKQLEEENCSEVMPHIVSAAKHFFELGLKAQKGE